VIEWCIDFSGRKKNTRVAKRGLSDASALYPRNSNETTDFIKLSVIG
jgi:formylglycine-generating enzyme required for sulfatase activity